jgi:hypothetical protein
MSAVCEYDCRMSKDKARETLAAIAAHRDMQHRIAVNTAKELSK